MRLGVILPHTKLYGGVKRFFELGEVFLKLNHEFYVFTPDGVSPVWYTGNVKTLNLAELKRYAFDALFITEVQFATQLIESNAKRKILYFVRPSDKLDILKQHPEIEIFANSTNGHEVAKIRYGVDAFKAFGGINVHSFYPKELNPIGKSEPFTILTYGRIVEKSKGTHLVVKACERLLKKGYRIKIVLFDAPVSKKAEEAIHKFTTSVPFEFVVNHPVNKNVELFHRGDVFVAAERKTGYSNTAAEAMACGLPVIGTSSGTKHFLFHMQTGILVDRNVESIVRALEQLINDFELRKTLARNGRKKIEEFSWEALAFKILNYISEPRQGNRMISGSLRNELRYLLHLIKT
jgi:glycosyltransferase involved in cell wall biosynthesis